MSVWFCHDTDYALVTYPCIQLCKIIDGGDLTKDVSQQDG